MKRRCVGNVEDAGHRSTGASSTPGDPIAEPVAVVARMANPAEQHQTSMEADARVAAAEAAANRWESEAREAKQEQAAAAALHRAQESDLAALRVELAVAQRAWEAEREALVAEGAAALERSLRLAKVEAAAAEEEARLQVTLH